MVYKTHGMHILMLILVIENTQIFRSVGISYHGPYSSTIGKCNGDITYVGAAMIKCKYMCDISSSCLAYSFGSAMGTCILHSCTYSEFSWNYVYYPKRRGENTTSTAATTTSTASISTTELSSIPTESTTASTESTSTTQAPATTSISTTTASTSTTAPSTTTTLSSGTTTGSTIMTEASTTINNPTVALTTTTIADTVSPDTMAEYTETISTMHTTNQPTMMTTAGSSLNSRVQTCMWVEKHMLRGLFLDQGTVFNIKNCSLSKCAGQCTKSSPCKSFFHQGFLHECYGINVEHSAFSNALNMTGYRYYVRG